MKETPILYSRPMVQAKRAGSKTQTRRIAKGDFSNPTNVVWASESEPEDSEFWIYNDENPFRIQCPYGAVGDILWGRETWSTSAQWNDTKPSELPFSADQKDSCIFYAADYDENKLSRLGLWRPSIFLPRRYSRILEKITNIRVQRLLDISEEDAIAEGIQPFTKDGSLFKYWCCDPYDGPLKKPWAELPRTAREAYFSLWDSINGHDKSKCAAANPWLWAITTELIQA